MNPIAYILLGLIFGGVIAAAVFFGLALISRAREFTSQISHLSEVLAPILSSTELARCIKAIPILSTQLEEAGRKLESVDNSIKEFSRRAFVSSETPAGSIVGNESGVYRYNEVDAAARDAADIARKMGIETDESRVSTTPAITEEAKDVF